MARWQSARHLIWHFGVHGHELGARTVDEYDASAQTTLSANDARYFTYFDDEVNEERVGCFHRASGRFVVLNLDDQIVTHFPTTERYIRRLLYNNYDG